MHTYTYTHTHTHNPYDKPNVTIVSYKVKCLLYTRKTPRV